MHKAVFLDRDGTINVDHGYVYRLENLELIPGALVGLKKMQDKGYKLIIITNQSGIGRGYYTEEDYLELRKELHRQLHKEGVHIDAEYYCPHAPEEDCECRKPHTGLIEEAIEEHDIDRETSYMIGDKTSDIKAGDDARLKTILVETGKAGKDRRYVVQPYALVRDILEASEIV